MIITYKYKMPFIFKFLFFLCFVMVALLIWAFVILYAGG